MSNVEIMPIECVDNGRGEELQGFCIEIQEQIEKAFSVPEKLLGRDNPRSDVAASQAIKQRLEQLKGRHHG